MVMTKQDTDRKTFHLRLPPALYTRIIALAERERRSMNEQMVWMLERLASELEMDTNDTDT